MTAPASVSFLGFTFDDEAREGVLMRLALQADRREPFKYVVTPNVDHAVRCARQPVRRSLYEAAWLVLNDSRILSALAAASGLKLRTNPGSDICEALFAGEIVADEPVTIIGADARTIEGLKARYRLKDVRWLQPPMGLAHNPQAIAETAAFIAANPSRFTFIACGAPQQEMVAWAATLRRDCVGVGLCVGASLEFLAGVKPRAPRWMRSAGLEWAHRLMSEPRRLARRYLVDGPEIFAVWARWAWAQRTANATGFRSLSMTPGET